jgi:hypothetical protein
MMARVRICCSVTRLMTRVTGRPLSTAGWKVSNLMYLCVAARQQVRHGLKQGGGDYSRCWHPMNDSMQFLLLVL